MGIGTTYYVQHVNHSTWGMWPSPRICDRNVTTYAQAAGYKTGVLSIRCARAGGKQQQRYSIPVARSHSLVGACTKVHPHLPYWHRVIFVEQPWILGDSPSWKTVDLRTKNVFIGFDVPISNVFNQNVDDSFLTPAIPYFQWFPEWN